MSELFSLCIGFHGAFSARFCPNKHRYLNLPSFDWRDQSADYTHDISECNLVINTIIHAGDFNKVFVPVYASPIHNE
jgi:hypothetical protein